MSFDRESPPSFKQLQQILSLHDPDTYIASLMPLAKVDDRWLLVLMTASRLQGRATDAFALYELYGERIEETPSLAYELALFFSGLSSRSYCAEWMLKCILKWPADRHFWALYLDLTVWNAPNELLIETTHLPTDDIENVPSGGIRALLYRSIGKALMAADAVASAYEQGDWDAYLNMAVMKIDLIQPNFITTYDPIDKHLVRASENEKLFYAIVLAKFNCKLQAVAYLNSLKLDKLYYSDVFLALVLRSSVGDDESARPTVLAYLAGEKQTPYGLWVARLIAEKIGDQELLQRVPDEPAEVSIS